MSDKEYMELLGSHLIIKDKITILLDKVKSSHGSDRDLYGFELSIQIGIAKGIMKKMHEDHDLHLNDKEVNEVYNELYSYYESMDEWIESLRTKV